ncbi:MAG: exo-alpha-sialidase, partial [Zoogloea sp.]|nr:exo-alpha-sialidase [Zoogloea sp.]
MQPIPGRHAFVLTALLLTGGAFAHEHEPAGHPSASARPAVAVGAGFDAAGELWRVRLEGETLLVDHS